MAKSKKKATKRKNNYLGWIISGIILIIAICIGIGISININSQDDFTVTITPNKSESTIDYSTEAVPALITSEEQITSEETGQGSLTDEIKTVEAVGSDGPVTEINLTECPDGEECARGAYVPTLDISSPQAFANQTLGVCLDVDGYYGSQCWDSIAAFFLNYTGHTLYTCGTGAAKGTIADGCWQQNAGDQFTMIWNPMEIQAGDIAVYSTGQWGHIGMAMGGYNNGYFTLLGQNQGGPACPGGGAAGNIINLSTRDFIGAFRPNIYIPPEPTPEPEVPTDKCKIREVFKGDTLGSIMLECNGEIKWGEAMNEYARHWISTKINPGNSVFYGWTHGTGYGLFAEDVIEYRD